MRIADACTRIASVIGSVCRSFGSRLGLRVVAVPAVVVAAVVGTVVGGAAGWWWWW